MPELIEVGKKKETAVLVAIINQQQSEQQTKEYLEELAFLASTLNVEAVKMFTQKLEHPDVRTFVGRGKLEEIKTFIKAMEVDIAIFDEDLTPSQLRNLEKSLEVTIFDRSLLILEIFLKRAKTSRARTQVELARYQYLLPRLTRMWTHLERQRGGTGTRGGAGEKEIETDRRIIRDKIALLKKKTGEDRSAKCHTKEKSFSGHPRCPRGLYECRQIHTYDFVIKIGCVCGRQTFCHG